MRSTLSKAAIESEMNTRFASAFKLHEKATPEVLSTGLAEVDFITGGLPRGAITEIFGPASSGRMSLMLSSLAYATNHDEVCALVDTNDALDPLSAADAGVDLDQLLWIRCAANIEQAFKATDLLLQSGGFGLVVLDIGDVPLQSARRIISSWWYRFRRVVENSPTALVVIAQGSCVGSCASQMLEMKREAEVWSSLSGRNQVPGGCQEPDTRSQKRLIDYSPSPHLLRGMQLHLERQKPIQLTEREVRFGAEVNS